MPLPRTPNLFMVGFPKAGSTSLARWLAAHPQIGIGKQKETKFLLDKHDPRRLRTSFWELGIEGYAKAFSNIPEHHKFRYLMDADVHYYSQRTALEQIPRLAEAPVIFLLREPVARLMSVFNFLKNNEGYLPGDMSFTQFVEKSRAYSANELQTAFGICHQFPDLCYAVYIQIWQEALRKENVSIIFFENVVHRPRQSVSDLVENLGLSAELYRDFVFKNERPTRAVASHRLHRMLLSVKQRNRAFFERLRPLKPLYERVNYTSTRPALSAEDYETIARLNDLVRPWNEELKRLIGIEALPWKEYRPADPVRTAASRLDGVRSPSTLP